METKAKPCSGIGKAKGVKGCGKEFKHRIYGLCASCLSDFIFGTDAGKLIMQKRIIPKAKKVSGQKKKEQTKRLKEKITNWREKLQLKIQEIVRLIDKGQPCPARGYTNCQFHAGHVYARGGNSTIALNLHNIHRQSAQSNHWQNDDLLFREGLKNEYGEDYVGFIGELRRTSQLKYKNEDYHHFYKKASQIALKLKKDYFAYPKQTRINLRNEINEQLGIYEKEFCIFEGRLQTPQ